MPKAVILESHRHKLKSTLFSVLRAVLRIRVVLSKPSEAGIFVLRERDVQPGPWSLLWRGKEAKEATAFDFTFHLILFWIADFNSAAGGGPYVIPCLIRTSVQ